MNVPLRRVVEDHVENDFDAGAMQGFDHLFEFRRGVALRPAGESEVRREIQQGVVTPVIGQSIFMQVILVRGLMDRKQFHGGDAQFRQVFQDRVRSEAGVGAANFFRQTRMIPAQAFDMSFVNDGFFPGEAGGAVSFPIERGVDHFSQGGIGGAVHSVGRAVC